LTVGGKGVYPDGLPRFERDGHFCCPGEFAVDVAPGRAEIRIERGPEYAPYVTQLDVKAGQTRRQAVTLKRWIDMNARGWYSGDLHVHRPVGDMPLLLRADDLNLAPVLTHWNRRHENVKPPYLVQTADEGAASPRPRCFHKLAQEDERAGGAVMLFNLKKPILLENVTRDAPSGFEYHRLALQQKAFVEVEKPFWWEAPVHVALGRVDTIGVACNHFMRTGLLQGEAWGRPRDLKSYPGALGFALNVMDLYYRYLNMGHRIAASGGSASGVLRNPLGYNRAYVRLEKFEHDAWYDALREGRNFVTNGPMLFVTVNGKEIGERFEVPAGGKLQADVALEARSRDALEKAEIVVGGKVVAAFRPAAGEPLRIAARHELTLDKSTWIAVRAFEPVRGTVVRFAHTSPFYVTVGGERPDDPEAARFYVKWLGELIAAYEKKRAAAKDPAPLDAVLQTYRKARQVYQAAAN
ncbi:MAG: CehA/McbA family metallohydrolase, partial [Phycisphaerae bacterium]